MYSRKDGRNYNPNRKTSDALKSVKTGVHKFAKEMKRRCSGGMLKVGIRDCVALSTKSGWTVKCGGR